MEQVINNQLFTIFEIKMQFVLLELCLKAKSKDLPSNGKIYRIKRLS